MTAIASPAASTPAFRTAQSAPWLAAMVLFWGLSWPAMKLAVGEVPPLWLATFRFASGAACLFALVAARGGSACRPAPIGRFSPVSAAYR